MPETEREASGGGALRNALLLRIPDDVAYYLPILLFLTLTWVGSKWQSIYPASYVAKTLLVTGVLYLLWPRYTPIRWNGLWLGVIVGCIGVVQWVGMQLWLQDAWPAVVGGAGFLPAGVREFLAGQFQPPDEVFDPTAVFGSTGTLFAWYAVRMAGAVLLVPVMEELFWRDWAWRTAINFDHFKRVQVGEWHWRAFVIVAFAVGLVHGHWWLTSIVWAAMIGALLVYTRSLGACIVAHAVTNLLLAVYVLRTGDWAFW
jgi:uncharacterized protein